MSMEAESVISVKADGWNSEELQNTTWSIKPAEPEFKTQVIEGIDEFPMYDLGYTSDSHPSAVTIVATYADDNYFGITEPLTITMSYE